MNFLIKQILLFFILFQSQHKLIKSFNKCEHKKNLIVLLGHVYTLEDLNFMQTYGNPNVTYDYWAGNASVTNRSGRFISSHVAHTGMIAFGAGSNTLFELSRFDPSLPMGDQGLVFLPTSLGISRYWLR